MNLVVHIPDELAARISGIDPARLQRAALDAVMRAADDSAHHQDGPDLTGASLIAAMQASPYRDIDIEPKGERLPVRGVDL